MTGPKNLKLPEKIIIAPTDPIYSAVRRAGGCTGKDKRLGLFRYTEIPGCTEPTAVAGPALGAPAAALLVEHLVPHGVKKIFLLSVCGSLIPELRIGDFFIPTGGISEEGTSKLYLEGRIPPPDKRICNELIKRCEIHGIKPIEGLVWTTDAPNRENKDKIISYLNQGAITVDMEFTALSTLSKIYRLKFAALMVVSDERFYEEQRIGFQTQRFLKALKKGAQILCNISLKDQ